MITREELAEVLTEVITDFHRAHETLTDAEKQAVGMYLDTRFRESIIQTINTLLSDMRVLDRHVSEPHLASMHQRLVWMTSTLRVVSRDLQHFARYENGAKPFMFSETEAKTFHQNLHSIDMHLLEITRNCQLLEHELTEDRTGKKRELLEQLGFPLGRSPVLGTLLAQNWQVFQTTLRHLPRYFREYSSWSLVWPCLRVFEDLICETITDADIQALRNEQQHGPGGFYEGLTGFLQQKQLLRREKQQRTVRNLEAALIIAAIAGMQSTHEHLDITTRALITIRKCMRNGDDLVLLKEAVTRVNRKDANHGYELLFCIVAVEHLYKKHPQETLSALASVRGEALTYALRAALGVSREFLHSVSDLKLLLSVFQKSLRSHNKRFSRFNRSNISSILGDNHHAIHSLEDVFAILHLWAEINDSEVIKTVISTDEHWAASLQHLLPLLRKVRNPHVFVHLLPAATGEKLSDVRKYPHITKALIENINKHPELIGTYEHNLIALKTFFPRNEDIETLFSFLRENDANLLFNLFGIFDIINRVGIPSFQAFIEAGGEALLQEARTYKNVPFESLGRTFCLNMVSHLQNRQPEEKIKIFRSSYAFFMKEVGVLRIKQRQLGNLQYINPRLFEYYFDFLQVVMEFQPKHFMKVLFTIGHLFSLQTDISQDILEVARVARRYRLALTEGNVSMPRPEDVERTYLFFCERLGRRPNVEKIRKQLNKINTQHRLSAISKINQTITDLAVTYFLSLKDLHLTQPFAAYCGEQLPEELQESPDAINALIIAKKCQRGSNKDVAQVLLRNICKKRTVPFLQYPEAYPFQEEANVAFVQRMRQRGIHMEPWLRGFVRQYTPETADSHKQRDIVIAEHIQEIREHYVELGIDSDEDVFQLFERVRQHPQQDIVNDIRGHLEEIKNLKEHATFSYARKQVIIAIENNPLRILQMGNVVSQSCLNVDGSSSWTTITNAVDVNKRVLFATNERGNILGRRIIAMTDDGHIIQLRAYTNDLSVNIPELFERFTVELAKACHAQVANSGSVSTLVGENWYAGSSMVPFDADTHDQRDERSAA